MRINPLNFFHRKVEILPLHFTTTKVNVSDYQIKVMDKWIHENCSGRYCLVNSVSWEKDSWKKATVVGFEDASDLTLFALGGKMNQTLPF